MKIEEFTICLHCGCNKEVVDNQIEMLKPLTEKYKVFWNNRIDRHPGLYPSYSQMLNHSIATSPTEFIFFINDRTFPKPEEVEKMIGHLETGHAWTALWGIGFSAHSKELVRKIGWQDERFINGGWEDRDWVWRMKIADLGIYEGHEGSYDQTWKSPLNVSGGHQSTPHWLKKYTHDDTNNTIIKHIPEEKYYHWDLFLGPDRPDISGTWKTWKDSTLDVNAGAEGSGPASSSLIGGREIIVKYS